MSRSQPSTSATKSASAVVPATPVRSKGAPVRAASVPQTEKKDHPIPPPKLKKGTSFKQGTVTPPTQQGLAQTQSGQCKVPAAAVKMGKGHKPKGTLPLGTMSPGQGLVTTKSSGMAATRTPVTTVAPTATCTTICTATGTSTATMSVCSILPKDQPSEAAGDGIVSPSTPTVTCTTACTGSISAACTTNSTATCTADATLSDVSPIPNVQPSESAGDVLDPGHAT
ncbi:hypothetical protein NDU88_005804 [Pleurodeles waltl]|uniref:Uncharacterized protein n=1 Tax=Pleurodeles waltl TaxID=8319 RepID=A0AAV7MI11_PLEWA|nr:hypothetical protein NDU88_005804 [Pleurodeles waltl]